MSHELQQEQPTIDTAWTVFQLWSGCRDEEYFQRSYLGHYPSRDAFGQELLARLGADGRIQRLSDWLQVYIRFDGEAVVRDFEQAGHFYVFDAPGDMGTFVFDPYERADE